MKMKVDFKTSRMTPFLCGLVSLLITGSVWSTELTQEISMGFNGSLTSPLSLPQGISFGLIFDTVSVEGQVSIGGTDFNQSLSSNHGTIEDGPFLVTLAPGEYTLTETYTAKGSSSNSLIGMPAFEVAAITFERPISVTETTTYTIEIHTVLQDVIPDLQGPFTVAETILPGVVEDAIALTLVAVEAIQKDQLLQYTASFQATVASKTTIVKASQDAPTDEPPDGQTDSGDDGGDEEPDTGENPSDEMSEVPPADEEESKDTGEKDQGKKDKPDKENGKGKPDGPPPLAKGIVRKMDRGALDFGPMPLTIELGAISDEPIDITAALDGNWRGKGIDVTTPAGVETRSIQIDHFEGTLEVSHQLDTLPLPIRVGLQADSGSITQHSQAPELPIDLFLRAKSIALLDTDTAQAIPWPSELLGPMPDMIKIKDGALQFIKSTGSAKEAEAAAQEAANAAEDAAEAAEMTAALAEKKSAKEAQKLARQATQAARRAAERAEKAERDANRAAERAAENTNDADARRAAERAQAAAENAKASAQNAEKAAKKAGKEATDLNDDGKNDIFDIVLTANAFGMRVSVEVEAEISDINGDGVVDLSDLILVAQGMVGGALIPDAAPGAIAAAPGADVTPKPHVFLRAHATDNLHHTVVLDVAAEVVNAVYAYELEIVFDETVLAVVGIEEGDLLLGDGALTYWDSSLSSHRRVHTIGTRLASDGISAAGNLATVTLRLKSTPGTVSDWIKSATVKISDVGGRWIESQLHVNGWDGRPIGRPSRSQLRQNYPNPFNPETWVPYQLSRPAAVVIYIYDATGGLVRTLDVGQQPAGFYHTRDRAAYWNGTNDAGERVASGLYFYQLRAGDFSATKKLVIRK